MRSKFVIFSRHYDPQSAHTYSRLLQLLGGRGCQSVVWGPLYDEMVGSGFAEVHTAERMDETSPVGDASAVLSVGGDGTFLAAAKVVMGTDVPVLGINRGRLGFLSDVAPDKLQEAIGDLLDGNYRKADVCVMSMYANDERSPIGYALNEFAVSKCDNSSMLTIDTYVDGDYLTTYWADGLIVATATGSTAYSLSVGGPIVYPTSPSLILTPVAPHNLTMRPLVLPDTAVLNLHVDGRGPNVMTSFDGQTHLMPNGGWLRIGKASKGVKRVQLRSYSFFETLRDKLLWGADLRNGKGSEPGPIPISQRGVDD